MAEIIRKLATPRVPNFIFFEDRQPVRKQDGWTEGEKVSIGDLPDNILAEIAKGWHKALIARAHEIRKNRRKAND